MKIGIIGGGNVGAAYAKRLGMAGHQILLSFSRDRGQMEETARQFGARVGTPKEAAQFGAVVVLAVPWQVVEQALREAGSLEGKILWNSSNALTSDYKGMAVGTTTSGSEIVASLARAARVVAAIPPAAMLLLSDDPTVNGKPAVSFVCGDDADAKAKVMPLVQALPAQAVDFGPLAIARFAEPAGMVIVQLGFFLNRGFRIGLSYLEETSPGT